MAEKIEARNIISLSRAMSEIKQACEEAAAAHDDNGDKRSPFFFFVGSGISSPAIPLASIVQQQCEAKARSLGRDEGPNIVEPTTADLYSHWFTAAYPHRIERQQYLRELIKPAAITQANLRLAHLLLKASVSNVVVTPNFDDLLSRALTLFGRSHVVCDDPRTVERIDPEKNEIQLVYVHGSYWFYDCRNTTDEIRDRARSSADTTLTMASFLDKILAYRSPLVVGYSGWEQDVFMTALKRRLLTPLPFNLYWFCYHRSEIARLPDDLRFHADVYFVVPPEEKEKEAGGDTETDDAAKLPVSNRHSESIQTAQTVFDKLIEELHVGSPDLTSDPLRYFAELLKKNQPKDDVEGGTDIYSFQNVVERVERAKVREEEEAKTAQKTEAQLEMVREALRQAHYEEAINKAREIESHDLTEAQARELLNLTNTAIPAMANDLLLKPSACELAITFYNEVEKKGTVQPQLQLVAANLFNTKGNIAYSAKQFEPALASFEEGAKRFKDVNDAAVQNAVASMSNNTGITLINLGKFSEALKSFETVISQHQATADTNLINQVVAAYVFKGNALRSLGKNSEAVVAYKGAQASAEKTKTLTPYAKTVLDASKASLAATEALVQAAAIQAAAIKAAADKATADKAAADKAAADKAAADKAA